MQRINFKDSKHIGFKLDTKEKLINEALAKFKECINGGFFEANVYFIKALILEC